MKLQEGELARQRLEATSHHQLMEDIKELETTIQDSEETMRASEARAKEMKAKADLLQDKVHFPRITKDLIKNIAWRGVENRVSRLIQTNLKNPF